MYNIPETYVQYTCNIPATYVLSRSNFSNFLHTVLHIMSKSKVVVYILCYDDASEQRAHREYGGADRKEWARVLRLPGNSKYMEGEMYLSVLLSRKHEWEDAAYVGTLAYKASDKIYVPDISALCERMRQREVDVISLMYLPEPALCQSMQSHARFLEVWAPLMLQLGYSVHDAVSSEFPLLLANYWLATPHWMLKYCAFYARAVRVLETHEALQASLWSYSAYRTHLSMERCMHIYGKPYIPYHPFVSERLPGFFFYHEKANIETVPESSEIFWKLYYGADYRAVIKYKMLMWGKP